MKDREDSGVHRAEEQVPEGGVGVTCEQPASLNSITDNSENGNQRSIRRQKRRHARESQAKKRMEAMVTTIDQKLLGIFIIILSIQLNLN